MNMIPVLDILHGQTVHGRAGHRETYQPVQSQLVSSACPLKVMEALRNETNSELVYVADLNGLMNHQPQSDLLQSLADTQATLLLDSGIRTVDDLEALPDCHRIRPVIASESLDSMASLQGIAKARPPESLVFSFDFDGVQLRTKIPEWQSADLRQVASKVWNTGIRTWIILDVRSVGISSGPTSLQQCARLRQEFPDAQLITGGGIRDVADLTALQSLGLDGVLLSTALHNRSLTSRMLAAFS